MTTQLSDNVWQLPLKGVNGYVVDGEETVLVDAGTPWDESRIRTGLERIGLDVSDLDRVLVTHYDLDHVGALASLAPDLEGPVHIRPPDAEFLTGGRKPPLGNHKGLLQRLLAPLVPTPDAPVRTVEDRESIGEFTAYATPGHTPGHTVYVGADSDVCFLGDLLRESDGDLEPTGWLISYDTAALAESVIDLADRAPAFEVAAVGHGDPIRTGGEDTLVAAADRLRS